jgi:hypothetical protein
MKPALLHGYCAIFLFCTALVVVLSVPLFAVAVILDVIIIAINALRSLSTLLPHH